MPSFFWGQKMEGTNIINIFLMENEESGESIVGLLEEVSDNKGIKLFVFDDAKKLLTYLKQFTPSGLYKHNIVLFHSKPPLNNVIKIIKEIKENSDLKITPIFIITDSMNKDDVRTVYTYHANCYITKPQDTDRLIQTINSFKELWFKHAQLP